MSVVLVLPCPAVRSPGKSQVCGCKCYQSQGSWWARQTPEGTRPTAPGCPTSGNADVCECVGCIWDQGTGAYWPQGVTPVAAKRVKSAPPTRELPPTRSDRLCGRNRYTSLDAAFSALWAHAKARGYAASTMVVVAHNLCPDLFHVVPRAKSDGFPEVHHA